MQHEIRRLIVKDCVNLEHISWEDIGIVSGLWKWKFRQNRFTLCHLDFMNSMRPKTDGTRNSDNERSWRGVDELRINDIRDYEAYKNRCTARHSVYGDAMQREITRLFAKYCVKLEHIEREEGKGC